MSSQPVDGGNAPAVAWHKARKGILWHRSAQIVPDLALVLEELVGDNCTNRVAAAVLGAGTATAIAEEPGEGVGPAWFEFISKYVPLHSASMQQYAAAMSLTRGSSFLALFLVMFALGTVSGLAAVDALGGQELRMGFSLSRVQTFLNAAGTYWFAASLVGAIAIATEALVAQRTPLDGLDDEEHASGDEL